MNSLSLLAQTVSSLSSRWILASVALVGIGVFAWSQRPDLAEMDDTYAYEATISPEAQELEKTFSTVIERMQANRNLINCVISGEVRLVDACEEYWMMNKNGPGFIVSMESRYSSVSVKVGARLNFLKLILMKINEDPVGNDAAMNRVLRDYEDSFGSIPDLIQL